MTKFKKIISLFTVVAIAAAALCCLSTAVFAAEDDLVIGDFSNGEVGGWTKQSNGTMEIVNDVARYGSAASLKWGDLGKSNYVYSPLLSGDNSLGKLLGYKYLNIWMYSDAANDQKFNLIYQDKTVNKYVQLTGIVNWSGWKLVQFDVSSYSLSKFAGSSETDDVQLFFNIGGWGTTAVDGTALYFDKIWFSNDNPGAIEEQSEVIKSSVQDGVGDVPVTNREVVFSADRLLKLEKDYYADKLTVSCGENTLTQGTDYYVYHELNKLYVVFADDLTRDFEYTITLNGNAECEDGTAIVADYSVSFTAGGPELAINEYNFSCGTALPQSGKITVTAGASNTTETAQTGALIVGVYDKTTNAMKALGIGNAVTVGVGETMTFSAEVSADSYDNCYVRAFLWDSADGMYTFGDYAELN